MKTLLMACLLLSSTVSAEEFKISYGVAVAGAGAELSAADAEAAKQQALSSTVRLKADQGRFTGHGTAVGVDLSAFGYAEKKYLLTAHHNTVDDQLRPEPIFIELNKKWVPCKVLAYHKDLDICLIESEVELSAVATLSPAEASATDRILLVGSPRGVPVRPYEGVVKSTYSEGVRSTAVVPFDHGCSGSPVFDKKTFKLSGIAVSGIPKDGDLDYNLALFVPLSAVASFLKESRKP